MIQQLKGIINNSIFSKCPVLVLINKSDLKLDVRCADIREGLVNDRVKVKECSAKTNEGIKEELQWLLDKSIEI